MEAQEQAPLGSYTWVTAPRVQKGKNSGFAGIQMIPRFGPRTRTALAAKAKETKGIFLPLHLCCGNHLALQGLQQQPTNPVALGVAEPMQPPTPGTPKRTSDPSRLPPTKGRRFGGRRRSAHIAETGALLMFLWQHLFFFFSLSFECSNHQ